MRENPKIASAEGAELPPLQLEARVGGALYLVVIASAFFAEMFARGSVIVSGDAAATARNMLASETIYRLGGISDLVNLTCDVGVAVVLYRILKPANPGLSLYAALMRVTADICLAVATFFHFAPLLFLKPQPYLAPFAPSQLQGFAYEYLRLHNLGYDVSLVFFGIQLIAVAYLILRSAILPRIIGVLLLISGACYLTNSFVHLVLPQISVPTLLLIPGLISELALALWLLVRGFDAARWQAALDQHRLASERHG
jgi:hypothetical protein